MRVVDGKLSMRIGLDHSKGLYTIYLNILNEDGDKITVKIPKDAITNTFIDVTMYEERGFRDSQSDIVVTKLSSPLRKDWR